MPRRKSTPHRSKAPHRTAPQQRIEFAYHANLNTPAGEVYHYLLRNPVWALKHGKSMVNETILTRWLPYARLDQNPALAKKTAQHSLRQLLRYIDELCRDFDLEYPFAPRQVVATPSPVYSAPSEPTPKSVEESYGRFDLFEDDR
jgi:hypothetical protein